ncbi:MAG TPA: hypothetical protein VFZ85_09810 [Jiangellaceae bacterium]
MRVEPIKAVRSLGRRRARSRFKPIAAAAIPPWVTDEAVGPAATTGHIATGTPNHQTGEISLPTRSAAASAAT